MSIKVDNNWWRDLFDEIYLLTDARSVCNEKLTNQEVDFLEDALDLDKSCSILDLCGGQGRHSLELSRRGYVKVTVLDYSQYLLTLGEEKAKREKLSTIFIQGDARSTGLPRQSYKFIIIMASSFGYFANEEENINILREAYRLLIPNGKILLDLPDKDYVINNLKSISSHTVNKDISVRRERELSDDIIFSREIVISEKKGCIKDSRYCTRLYTPEKISELMYHVGFSSVVTQKGFMNRGPKGDFGCMTNRMVVLGEKA
jgi:D-alanine-D-alanine ligase